MDKVEIVARVLATRARKDPDRLEPGNVCVRTDWIESKLRSGDYDHLFDDGSIKPDGHNGKDECHFVWREYIFDAQAVLRALEQ